MRTCTSCSGAGVTVREAFSYEGRSYPEKRSPCASCEGRGTFSAPCDATIEQAIKGRASAGSARLRSARPKDRRAHYVWRMARFHGGVDMTMPVMASVEIHGDPYRAELDALADAIARKYLGSDLRAARRWGHALCAL